MKEKNARLLFFMLENVFIPVTVLLAIVAIIFDVVFSAVGVIEAVSEVKGEDWALLFLNSEDYRAVSGIIIACGVASFVFCVLLLIIRPLRRLYYYHGGTLFKRDLFEIEYNRIRRLKKMKSNKRK